MNDSIDGVSAEGYSLMAYRPKGKRIRVVQQFVNTIQEDDTFCEPPDQPSEQDDDNVLPYDFIGAAGIRTDRRGKKTVLYHVKWKGYGIKHMTWEPESHLPEEDLLKLWSKYGRIGTTRKKGRQGLRHRVQQLRQCQCYPSEVHETSVREMAYAHHVTPSKSLEVVEAPCEQNFKRDGGGGGLFLSKEPNSPAESDGADAGGLSRCSPPPLPHHSPASSQQSFDRLGDARQNSLESIPQPEFLDTSQGSQSKEVTSSSHTDTPDIKQVGPASVVSDVSVHQVRISHDKAKRKGLFTRTRSGCLSCRRRRKKCDEGRPSCE